MSRSRKDERLFKRGRTWYTWVYDSKGKRHIKTTRCTDKTAARMVARKFEREILDQESKPPTEALGEAIKLFLESRISCAESTQEIYEYHCIRIVEWFGDGFDINEIKLGHVEEMVFSYLRKGYGAYNLERTVQTLRSILHHMKRHGFYHGVPSCLTPQAIKGAYNPTKRFLTTEEYRRLYKVFLDRFPNRADYIQAYVNLGCRRSELFRIRPKDVDFESNQVFIDGTKNSESKRKVPMTNDIRATLKRRIEDGYLHRVASSKKFVTVKIPDSESPIFPKWSDLWRVFKWACEDAGISPQICVNDLRRTFCSMMLNANNPTMYIADMMGHTSTDMIEAVYGAISAEAKAKAVTAIPSVQGPSDSGTEGEPEGVTDV